MLKGRKKGHNRAGRKKKSRKRQEHYSRSGPWGAFHYANVALPRVVASPSEDVGEMQEIREDRGARATKS